MGYEWHFFTCPKCGSHHFGTSLASSRGDKDMGRCHGVGCGYSWDRELDESLGFTSEPEWGAHGTD